MAWSDMYSIRMCFVSKFAVGVRGVLPISSLSLGLCREGEVRACDVEKNTNSISI
jgi:hypothetical protein